MTVDLRRFIEAQDHSLERAIGEIEAGRKQSHWMRFTLFGSPDNSKLVSSLTLFTAVAHRLDPPRPDLAIFATQAEQILHAATTEGLAECTTTKRFAAR